MLNKNIKIPINEDTEIISNDNTQNMENECEILNSPMISIEKVEKILKQMKQSVCEINDFISKCTGFFSKIKIDNNEIMVLITALHGIENSDNLLILSNNEESKQIYLDDSRIIYKNKNFDICIIEIKSSDKINYPCLEIDEKYIKEKGIYNYNNKPGYILGYPCKKECTFSFGKIRVVKRENKTYIKHFCSTIKGSSGSPIILLESLKCIGIHLQGDKSGNVGNFLYSSINSFINIYKNENSKKDKSKIEQKNAYIYPKNMKLILNEDSSPIIRIRKEKLFVNQNSFYKNGLKNIHNLDSNLDSGNIESFNENEDEIDNTKIEIKNINCKNKMINHYQLEENERLKNKNNIINTTGKNELTSYKSFFKNNEKEKTSRSQNSPNIILKNYSNIFHNLTAINTINLVHNNKEKDNNKKNKLNNIFKKKVIKNHQRISSPKFELNNINLRNKINVNKNINRKDNNVIFNTEILSERKIMNINNLNHILNLNKSKIIN